MSDELCACEYAEDRMEWYRDFLLAYAEVRSRIGLLSLSGSSVAARVVVLHTRAYNGFSRELAEEYVGLYNEWKAQKKGDGEMAGNNMTPEDVEVSKKLVAKLEWRPFRAPSWTSWPDLDVIDIYDEKTCDNVMEAFVEQGGNMRENDEDWSATAKNGHSARHTNPCIAIAQAWGL
jgi:hypothetical protein